MLARTAMSIIVTAACIVLATPTLVTADCSEAELTAVFLVEGIYFDADQPRDTESYWQVDTFNCANLDTTIAENHAWWCGAQFTSCGPGDPPEGYGNAWNQWLDWQGEVPDPDTAVTVTVRARLNVDSEPGYDTIHLQCVRPDDVLGIWQYSGFASDLLVEETFTLQPEDLTHPFDTVHLRWCFNSDGAWSDEDCLWPTAGAVQIDLIEVYFDQGAGPVQVGVTETCEPGDDLQWQPAVEEMRLTVLDVAPVGAVTDPTVPEMIEAVEAVQPYPGGYQHLAQAGPFHLFFVEPGDLGGCAIVDGRDGRVVYAATIVWMGMGSVTLPATSSHVWSFPPGDPAAGPATVEILPNDIWSEQHGTPAAITDAVLEYLGGGDVLRSFADCGAYDVVSYIYTPEGSGLDQHHASQVIIVSGHCGPPWNDVLTAAPALVDHNVSLDVMPNPFNPRTVIRLGLDRPERVEVAIFDLAGRRLDVLHAGELAAGRHEFVWDGRDDRGRGLASGTYVVRLESEQWIESRTIVLVR